MTKNNLDFVIEGIEKDIEEILCSYVKVESYTNTINEKLAERFFLEYFSTIPYFRNTNNSYGSFPIEDDIFDRSVCYAMLKGIGEDTVVLIHHSDIVGVEDFKLLKDYAFKPNELKKELLKIKDNLSRDVRKDLEEDTFLFGRGVCDMKGGGAIQIALLKRYSEIENFKGNIVLIVVPDEENLSIGMRSAVKLLNELKETNNLNYKLMINSEPHQRKDFNKGIFSEGSVGKIMPFIYVRGALTHVGKVYEGLNPLNIMSSIVRKTELNMDFSDSVGQEASPPPTWLYLRDGKEQYDVSMPLRVKGCFSVLTLNRTPQDILNKVKNICIEAFDEVLRDMNESYQKFNKSIKTYSDVLPWKTNVVCIRELYQEAEDSHGEDFTKKYDDKLDDIEKELKNNEVSLIEANFELLEFIYSYIDNISPRVVYGLLPPYYPNVSNQYFKKLDLSIENISEVLNKFTQERFNQTYIREYFYTGISDLSYTSVFNSEDMVNSLKASMPLFGRFYDIPIDIIEKISMPCINIGPWGKDFHKLTERVLIEDLYNRTPKIINYAINTILEN